MSDLFKNVAQSLESPATRLINITPDDGSDLTFVTRAINVAESGAVRVTTRDDDIATVTVAAGVPFPIRVKRIWSTGTTATGIVAMS